MKFGKSHAGKSAGRIQEMIDVVLRGRGPLDMSEQPLLGKNLMNIIDLHGDRMRKIMEWYRNTGFIDGDGV